MTLESNYLISSMKLKLLLITYMECECLRVINILITRAAQTCASILPVLPFYKWKYNFIRHCSRDTIALLPFQDLWEYDSR